MLAIGEQLVLAADFHDVGMLGDRPEWPEIVGFAPGERVLGPQPGKRGVQNGLVCIDSRINNLVARRSCRCAHCPARIHLGLGRGGKRGIGHDGLRVLFSRSVFPAGKSSGTGLRAKA